MRRPFRAFGLAGATALWLGLNACGGGMPTTPSPGPGGGGGTQPPPPVNDLPVIDSITIQGTRAKEPSNFADLAETVGVTAIVHDNDTPVDQLQYQWSATAGTFTGAGASATWQAPMEAQTPMDVTITLTVVEKYGQPGGPLVYEHSTAGTARLSLHDSAKEVSDMARQFLLDFSDSSIQDVSYIMRNFLDAGPICPRGKADETSDVTSNRANFIIRSGDIGTPAMSVRFGGVCPYPPPNGKPGDACAEVPVHWISTLLPTNQRDDTAGTDQVTAFYVPDQQRWGLCESSYKGDFRNLNITVPFLRR